MCIKMMSLFHRKANLKLFASLLAISIAYVTMVGRFLLVDQNNHTNKRKVSDRSTSIPKSRDTNNDDVVTTNYSNISTDWMNTVKTNVKESLQRILDFFPLEMSNERQGNRRKSPQKGDVVKRTVLPATGNDTNLGHLIDETTWQVKTSVENELGFALIAHAKNRHNLYSFHLVCSTSRNSHATRGMSTFGTRGRTCSSGATYAFITRWYIGSSNLRVQKCSTYQSSKGT